MKHCMGCREDLPESDFGKLARSRDGLNTRCTSCARRSKQDWINRTGYDRPGVNKVWYEANKDRVRAYQIEKAYGITRDEYELLLRSQNGVCAVCDEPCPSGRELAVDHDHDTGVVRGLLCMNCNRAAGYLRDSVKRALSLAAYLERK